MGSPVKFSSDELGRMSNAIAQKSQNLNFSMLPVILPIDKIFINKIELSCNYNPIWEDRDNFPPKKAFPKSGNNSTKSLDPEQTEKIKGMTMNLNLSRKVLSIEFDIERNQEDDGAMDEEPLNQWNNTS